MPRRPPKKWMRDCVRGARKSADDPGAACGALWYHKMSPAQRAKALRKERRKNPTSKGLLQNPLVWILGGGALAWGGYMLLTKKGGVEGSVNCASLQSQLSTLQAELQVANNLGNDSLAAQKESQIVSVISQMASMGC